MLAPLRGYHGYVYDNESGLYYLQSRYYNPERGRFINADSLVSTGQGILGNNMFAYCRNNPVRRIDVSGTEDADADKVNLDETDANDDLFGAGKPGGGGNSSCGTGQPPVGNSTGSTAGGAATNRIGSVGDILRSIANKVSDTIHGRGPTVGTAKHALFKQLVDAQGLKNVKTEQSYKNGQNVPYGTKGSIRFDVLVLDENGNPIHAFDLKTGSATLTDARIAYMQSQSGLIIPIDMIK